jgi:hypothetical protein
MSRRRFIAGVILAATPLGATASAQEYKAQQAGKVSRIALIASGAPQNPVDQDPFFERLRELGWVYGRDVVAERRAYGDRLERIPRPYCRTDANWSGRRFCRRGSADAVGCNR